MARIKKNNVEYFPHHVNHGKKMNYVRLKYKNDGYAVWFMLLEELGKADNHYLDLEDECQLMYLSSELMVSEAVLIDIIDMLVKLKVFDVELWNENRILYNQEFVDNIKDAYKRRSNGCINKESLLQILSSQKRIRVDSKLPKIESKEPEIKKDTSIREKQFNDLWELYDYKKSKKRSLSLFLKLKNEDVEKIKKTIVAYINETKGSSYRKHLSTYLSNECWNDVTYEIKTTEINHHLGLATAEKVVALFNATDLTVTIKKYKTNKANILIRLNEFLELKSDYKKGTTDKALEWFLNSLKFSLPTEVTDEEERERIAYNWEHKEAILLDPSLKREKRND